MTTKEWLTRARNLDKEINRLLAEKEKALSAATSSTAPASGEKVQTSRRNSSESKFLNYAEYSELIDNRIDELYAVKKEILSAINELDSSTLRTLLIARYINFHTWEEIAVEMNYSYMHVCRLHGKALQKIKDVIECYSQSVL